MVKTTDINVIEVTPIIAPKDLRQVFPLSVEAGKYVNNARDIIRKILRGEDNRLIAIVGPCSIHDPRAALEYAEKLKKLSDEISDKIFVVMRVYFEKPRTTVGWKGLINDPDMNHTHQISKGLGIARQLMCAISELSMPIACEMLDPISPQYLADMISWGAIGARTTESQTHRELASGLSFPVGFKNGTDGGLKIATDAMATACRPHSFLGINTDGMTALVHTAGNPDVHIVLRGGNDAPNYFKEDIDNTVDLLKKNNLSTAIMVDCSHANSYKDHNKQPEVLENVIKQIKSGQKDIIGVMIESNLNAGNQDIPKGGLKCMSELKYGVSVTDKCVDWETTVSMLKTAHNLL
ncbi:MAG: 3-deoxy-7-phosphoheptulonate synthase [Deferribacterales bacterium]